jgi:hypothetical protein
LLGADRRGSGRRRAFASSQEGVAGARTIPTPSFFRYALFAFAMMLPAHIVTTAFMVLLDR